MFQWIHFDRGDYHITYSPINLPICKLNWKIFEDLEHTLGWGSVHFEITVNKYIDERIQENV